MRITLSIDDDVLSAARDLAAQQQRSVGKVISDLTRAALGDGHGLKVRNGVPQLHRSGSSSMVTLELVNALRDEGL
ncbi:MAG: CopG family transcriptional regulator [Alphaproteobacteria bacterium]|nr:MAG: CopG family transcriptional regulator [Alphaproteobacteria bacterium]